MLDWQKILKFCAVNRIDWYFSPPSAPWWGGWFKRLVGVTKSILRKVLGRACLSYESLTTALCDVEAIVNSRPLTFISEDAEDPRPLTPAHFLHENCDVSVVDLAVSY